MNGSIPSSDGTTLQSQTKVVTVPLRYDAASRPVCSNLPPADKEAILRLARALATQAARDDHEREQCNERSVD
jgi:hypothetical protein